MSPWLGSLPYDLIYGTALYLDIDDVVNLHNSTRHLRFLLQDESLCRKLLEARDPLLGLINC